MSVKDSPPNTANLPRCLWCTGDALYVDYHDHEWGVPKFDQHSLFEHMVLEGMQAGLSWLTVLKKRERMRERFYNFDVSRLARASERSLTSWLKDSGLIRHRGKMAAMVHNARTVQTLDADFSASLWSFVDHVPQQGRHRSPATVPAITPESTQMARWLKQQGFRFVGPTTCYALMQSAGLVNDHLLKCYRHAECRDAGTA